jgi:hypothetical protein
MNYLATAASKLRPNFSSRTSHHSRSNRATEDPALLEDVPEHGDAMQFPSSHSHDSESIMDEEFNDEIEDVLEERGLYSGSYLTCSWSLGLTMANVASYHRLILQYALTPLTAVLVFAVLLGVTPLFPKSPSHPYPYTQLFPYPLPEILVGLSGFTLGLAVRNSVYILSSLLISNDGPQSLRQFFLETVPPALVNAIWQIFLRLGVLSVLLIPQTLEFSYPTFKDPVFG